MRVGGSFNHDRMLKTYPGADGMKTGYTDAAGHNLVTSAVRDGVRLIGVVLGAGSNAERDRDMTLALNDSFQDMGHRTTRVASLGVIASAHAAGVEPLAQVTRAQHVAPVQRAAEREPVVPVSGWTVQVGSFRNPHSARTAAVAAQRKTHRGDPHVEKIRLKHRTWWRAQVTGLTEAKAQEACWVLARHHKTRCIVLRPERPVMASK